MIKNLVSLVEINTKVIDQLKRDIISLNKKVDQRGLQQEKDIKILMRDLEDRWAYLSELTINTESIVKGCDNEKRRS